MEDRSQFQALVDRAVVRTAARLAVLSRYDAERRQVHLLAWAGLQLDPVRQALTAVHDSLPGFDPHRFATRSDANAANRRVYVDGEPVTAPFGELVQGVIADRVVTAAANVVGIHHSYVYPLRAGVRVVGSLAFHVGDEATPSQLSVYAAAAREAAAIVAETPARPRHNRDTAWADRLVARAPAIPFVLFLGLLFAVTRTLTNRLAATLADGHWLPLIWSGIANLAALPVAVAIAWLVRRLAPASLYYRPPNWRRLVLSYSGYLVAGLLAGATSAGVLLALAAAGQPVPPSNPALTTLAYTAAYGLIGLLANQFIGYDERTRDQQRRLRNQIHELRRSREQLTRAEDRLRREIAELLHGRVQTRLLVAWHRLGQCEALLAEQPEQARRLLGQIRDDLDEIREHEVRRASHLLHPSVIQIGLVPAIRSLLSQFEGPPRIELDVAPELESFDDPAENRLPEALRLVAYRVVEEALANAFRHARASQVEVRLRIDEGTTLSVVVRDDGAGFEPSAVIRGLGLTSIHARVMEAGGTWEIQSEPGQGTAVSCELPLVKPPGEAS